MTIHVLADIVGIGGVRFRRGECQVRVGRMILLDRVEGIVVAGHVQLGAGPFALFAGV